MNNFRKNYPVGSIICMLLSFIGFEYHTSNASIYLPGVVAGVIVMIVIIMILFYRIFDAVQTICITHGILQERVSSKYDILLPIGLVGILLQGQFFGEHFVNFRGEYVPKWTLRWSQPELVGQYIIALVAVVLLLRIKALLEAIAQDK